MKKLKIKKASKFGKYYTVGIMEAFQDLTKEIVKIRTEMKEDDLDQAADFMYLGFMRDIQSMKKRINSLP